MEILAGGGFGRKGMVPTIVGMRGNRKGEPRDGRGKGQVAELYIEIANNRDTKEILLLLQYLTLVIRSISKGKNGTILSILAYPGKNESASKNLIL